eukprot:CAMPEP_0194742004 /NCGR_PEP_ID=MMETSP0296-20130528/98363_1 /TAXON_ID=39354 /ORGANISM="Heterosigma akashiwo, Strain CCMP2393" /LENGTH=84 /DNA_ID=CAMNT_0039653775 /DNA_START=28 /DNA_END=278 /DNA_ORIENTATION=+
MSFWASASKACFCSSRAIFVGVKDIFAAPGDMRVVSPLLEIELCFCSNEVDGTTKLLRRDLDGVLEGVEFDDEAARNDPFREEG